MQLKVKVEKIQLQSSTIQAQDSVIKLRNELLKCKEVFCLSFKNQTPKLDDFGFREESVEQ